MSYDIPDVYYQPEAFGLVPIGELDDPNANYSFDIFAVWKHEETGTIYYGTDSGCSCPSPFEDYTSLDQLTKVTFMFDFIDDVRDYFNHLAPWDDDYNNKLMWSSEDLNHDFQNFKADCLELINKVREA